MGMGSWSGDVYDRVTKSKIDSGSTFSYSADAFRSGSIKPHETMDIKGDNGPKVRESRDSDEHPESTPIIVAFDETGSMGENPEIVQKSLKELFGMLVRKDIVSDPQIAVAAYGDMECDEAPVQIGQFESDNRIDDELDNILIEGCGGGNGGESSAIIPYYAARYVKTDAWEKRHKKGYIFLIGDECSLDIKKSQLTEFLGEKEPVDISATDAYKSALEKWNVYFLLIDNYAAKYQYSEKKYTEILGKDHVTILEDATAAAAVIAAIIGLNEETINKESVSTELVSAGFSTEVANTAAVATTGVSKKADDIASVPVEQYGDLNL